MASAPSPTHPTVAIPTPRPAPAVVSPSRPAATPAIDAVPEVWSSNGYDGQTFEYKTNCFGEYETLESCFLSEVTRVAVVSPEGAEFDLEKDFNVNAYSGEVTRRWVLYGPSNEGLPIAGQYRFNYSKGGELVLEQRVEYQPEVIDFPRDVSWQKDGDDLTVEWMPPSGVLPGVWYKVLVFPEKGQLISQVFEWDSSGARLKDIPLNLGDRARVNVAVYFSGGYAYSEYVPIVWGPAGPAEPPSDLALPFRVEDIAGEDGFISPFGIVRHSRDSGHGHGGIDIPLKRDAPIFAVADGTILSAKESTDGAGGFDVTLLVSGSDGEGWGFLYEHVTLRPGIKVGDNVIKRQMIGTNGLSTDRRNNHFELSSLFNDFRFRSDHRCWVEYLDPPSKDPLLGYFNSQETQVRVSALWETASEEGVSAYQGLLDREPSPSYGIGLK